MENRVGRRAPAVERFEHGDPVGAGHRSLAIQADLQQLRGGCGL
jgi:hypothetical protein